MNDVRAARAADHAERYRTIQRALLVTLGLNLAVAAAKFAWGTLSGSVSMRADGIASMFDGVSNLVGIVGMALATRPPDEGHPYGHAKFETYASVAIGVMLLLAAWNVLGDALAALGGEAHGVRVTPVSYAVMVGTLAMNVGVCLYERRVGAELGSEVLSADARHTASDALVSLSVIASLALVQAGLGVADAACSLVVVAAILHSAWEVFQQANETLSDKARIPAEEVAQAALAVPGVRSVHHVRTRGTESEVYVDLHVLLDPTMSLALAHALGESIERRIHERFPQVEDVTVHIEPDTPEERSEHDPVLPEG